MNRFIAGYIIAVSSNSLFQDSLGVDKYCAMCKLAWVDSSITIPYAIFGIFLAIVLIMIGDK